MKSLIKNQPKIIMENSSSSVIGPQTQAQWIKSVQSGTPNVSALTKSTTARYDVKSIPAPSSPFSVQPSSPSRSSTPSIGPGSFIGGHPIQLSEAVKIISNAPAKNPKFSDTLTPELQKAYKERLDNMDTSSYQNELLGKRAKIDQGGYTGKFMGAIKDFGAGVVAPAVTMEAAIGKKLGFTASMGDVQDAQEAVLQAAYKQIDVKQYTEARETYNSYLKLKLDGMSDHDVITATSDHPLITSAIHGLAVGTAQFFVLKDLPLLSQLGKAMEGVAEGVGAATIMGDLGLPAAKAITSRYGMSLAKMAVSMAGEIPAGSVIPALNFDYKNRPLSELPKEIAVDLAMLIPSAFLLHGAGYAGVAAVRGAREPVMQAVGAANEVVIKGAAKVMGMLKALRVPFSPGMAPALERAAMQEENNIFTPILNSLSSDERLAFKSHFQQQRFNQESESRMIEMRGGKKGRPGIDFAEPLPEPPKDVTPVLDAPPTRPEQKMKKVGTARVEVATASMREFREGNRKVSIEKAKAVEVAAQNRWAQMAANIKGFREGLQEGRVNTKADILEYQEALERQIIDSLPPEYRGRALPLIKRATTVTQLSKAVERLDQIVRNVKISELGLGVERGGIKRTARGSIKTILDPRIQPYEDLMRNFPELRDKIDPTWDPPSIVEPMNPPALQVWFHDLMGDAVASKVEAGMEAANTSILDQFGSARDLPKTHDLLKTYAPTVDNQTTKAGEAAKEWLLRNFKEKGSAETTRFSKYLLMKSMMDNIDNAIPNGKSDALGIPSNPSAEWLQAAIAEIETPEFAQASKEFTALYAKFSLQPLIDSGRLTLAQAQEWVQKFPNYLPSAFEKYMAADEGIPFDKHYNFGAADYLTERKGGQGLEQNANFFNLFMRSAKRAITDKYSDEVASTMREELGLKPLKTFNGETGRTYYQAIVDGELLTFDAQDLVAGQVPALKGQRVLYSSYDQQAFLVTKELRDMIVNEKPSTPAVQRVVGRLTRTWQMFTTSLNMAWALVSNPTKDFSTSLMYTKHATADMLKAQLTSIRDGVTDALFQGNITQNLEGKFEIDDAALNAIKNPYKKFMNYLYEKANTPGWQDRVYRGPERGSDLGSFFADMARNDRGNKEFNIKTLDPRFINNPYIRGAVKLKNNTIGVLIDSMLDLGAFMEAIPRRANENLTYDLTGNPVRASVDSMEGTLNFRQQGTSPLIGGSRAYLPYTYTQIKGFSKYISFIFKGMDKYDKAGNLVPMPASQRAQRILTLSVAPSIALWFYNKSMGVYDRMDAYTRSNYWPIPTGANHVDEYGSVNPIVVMVRMNEEQSYVANIVYGLMDHYIAQDPQAFNRIGMGKLSSWAMAKLPGYVRVYQEMDANYSNYRQQPIEPLYMAKYPEENRRFKGTTDAGEVMGRVLGVSPIKGDYWIQETAPAVYSFIRAWNRADSGNRALAIGKALHILSEPTTFFTDKDLEKQKNLIKAQANADMKNKQATPEQRIRANNRITKELNVLEEMIIARFRLRVEHPLRGKIINLPKKK